MAEVITCREYNRRGFERHREAVDEWKEQSHYTTYPSIAFFISLSEKDRIIDELILDSLIDLSNESYELLNIYFSDYIL